MHFDAIVVGSGQAGLPLSARLAGAGRRVLLAERAELGGTCVNSGCTPTKTMIASARAAHVARGAGRLGVVTGAVSVDLAAVVDRKNDIVRQWREGGQRRVDKAGARLTLAHGAAHFVAERELEIAGERYTADVVVINVGGRPVVPKLPGLDDVPWLDNATVMDLRQLPRHLLVLGGGYIGCEFAQMFRRFGSAVTIVDHAQRLMSFEDADCSDAVRDVFAAEGIALVMGANVTSVSRNAQDVVLHQEGGGEIRGSHLLLAVGRRPNTDDLGCEAGGIELDARGYVIVDDGYATSALGVYAVGDCTPGPQFTHAAWDDHRILFDRLTGRGSKRRSERLVPITAFTDPPLARVGLTESEATKKGIAYEKATMPFGSIARAVEIDERAGIMKLLLDPSTEKVLGVAIVGAEAGELIHVFVPVIQAGISARALVEPEYVHPTFAEGLQSLVMKLPRYALS
jgi:pyruvate/2-oxoglutarate dehydrogenase complex dihydrolipoamide dehydrogenase (E3) component